MTAWLSKAPKNLLAHTVSGCRRVRLSQMQVDGPELDQAEVDEAAARLLDAAPEGSEVVLFGSYARGDARAGSDLDFLVIEPNPLDPHGERVRLRNVLRDSPVGVDVLVVSRARFEAWRHKSSTIDWVADREGRRHRRSARCGRRERRASLSAGG